MNLNFNFNGKTLLKKWWTIVRDNFTAIQTAYNELHTALTTETEERKSADNTHATVKGTNSVLGHVNLSDSCISDSDRYKGIAATPYAVKAAYDKGNKGIEDAAAVQTNLDAEKTAREAADTDHAAVKGNYRTLGHVKLTDNFLSGFDETNSVAATPYSVRRAYDIAHRTTNIMDACEITGVYDERSDAVLIDPPYGLKSEWHRMTITRDMIIHRCLVSYEKVDAYRDYITDEEHKLTEGETVLFMMDKKNDGKNIMYIIPYYTRNIADGAITKDKLADDIKESMISNYADLAGAPPRPNLLLNSGTPKTGTEYPIIESIFGDIKPKAGDAVTLSINATLPATATGIGLYNSIDVGDYAYYIDDVSAGTHTYTKTVTWKVPPKGTTDLKVFVFPQNTEATINWVKCEMGEGATDWIENPADTLASKTALAALEARVAALEG